MGHDTTWAGHCEGCFYGGINRGRFYRYVELWRPNSRFRVGKLADVIPNGAGAIPEMAHLRMVTADYFCQRNGISSANGFRY